MNEAQVLAVDSAGDVANCSVTEYDFAEGQPSLIRYNFIEPVEAETAVTDVPDRSVAAG